MDFCLDNEIVREKVQTILDIMLGKSATGIYITHSTQDGDGYPEVYSELRYLDGKPVDFYNYVDDTDDISVANGASRVVFIPENEDFVIKMPITHICGFQITLGRSVDGEDDEMAIWKDLYGDDYLEYINEIRDEGPEWEETGNEFKIDLVRNPENNIMEQENEMVREAMEEFGCSVADQILLPNLYWGDYNGIPVYVQKKCKEKADNAWGYNSSKQSDKQKKIMTDEIQHNSPIAAHIQFSFVYNVIAHYGESEAYAFFRAADILGLSDLHGNNYGYNDDDMPVMFDYGGYDHDYVWNKYEEEKAI